MSLLSHMFRMTALINIYDESFIFPKQQQQQKIKFQIKHWNVSERRIGNLWVIREIIFYSWKYEKNKFLIVHVKFHSSFCFVEKNGEWKIWEKYSWEKYLVKSRKRFQILFLLLLVVTNNNRKSRKNVLSSFFHPPSKRAGKYMLMWARIMNIFSPTKSHWF